MGNEYSLKNVNRKLVVFVIPKVSCNAVKLMYFIIAVFSICATILLSVVI